MKGKKKLVKKKKINMKQYWFQEQEREKQIKNLEASRSLENFEVDPPFRGILVVSQSHVRGLRMN